MKAISGPYVAIPYDLDSFHQQIHPDQEQWLFVLPVADWKTTLMEEMKEFVNKAGVQFRDDPTLEE